MYLQGKRPRAFASQQVYRRYIEIMFASEESIISFSASERKDETFPNEDQILSLPIETAQELMDELWRVGLRPTEGSGSAGALAAVQKHLEFAIQIHHEDVDRVDKLLGMITDHVRAAEDGEI